MSIHSASSFRMVVEDILFISGRGLVVMGQVASSSLKPGDIVAPEGTQASKQYRVSSIEGARTTLDSCEQGDQVGLLLSDAQSRDIQPGQTIFRGNV